MIYPMDTAIHPLNDWALAFGQAVSECLELPEVLSHHCVVYFKIFSMKVKEHGDKKENY